MISLLADYPHFIPILAGWLYDEWGRTNPAASLEGNIALLEVTVSPERAATHAGGRAGFEAFGDCNHSSLGSGIAS